MTVTMEATDRLVALLRRAARRLTLQSALHAGITAGTAVAGALVLAAAGSLVLPLAPIPVLQVIGLVLGSAALVSVALALTRRDPLLTVARLLDVRAGLEERSSTALEVLPRADRTPLARRVISDAVRHLEPVPLAGVFPTRLPRRAWVGLALVVVLVIWPYLLRGTAIPGTPAARTQQTIRREGSRLEQFARELAARTSTARAPQTRRAAPRIRELGRRLQRDRLDRAEALGRIAELSRQIEETRREIDSALQQRAARAQGGSPDLLRQQALQQQIRQLRELTARLQQNPTGAQDILQRLAEINRGAEEAGASSPPRSQALQQAEEELRQGRVSRTNEILNDALLELESLSSMLADAEGLRAAGRALDESQQTVATGGGGRERAGTAAESGTPQREAAPGSGAPQREAGGTAGPQEGPHEGIAPGQGVAQDKMGAPSPRIQSERTSDRLRGLPAEGVTGSADVVGPAKPGTVLEQARRTSPAFVPQADVAMDQARTPGRYRALVRRYFQALARLR